MTPLFFQVPLPTVTPPAVETIPVGTYILLVLLSLLAAGAASWGMLRLAFKRSPFEIINLKAETHLKDRQAKGEEADYAAQIQEIATKATQENLNLRTDLETVRKQAEENVRSLQAELTSLRNEYIQFKEAHNQVIAENEARHNREIQEIRKKHDIEVNFLREAHASEMAEIKKSLVASQLEARGWHDYSTRLIAQMAAEVPDLKPVPFKPRERTGNTEPLPREDRRHKNEPHLGPERRESGEGKSEN